MKKYKQLSPEQRYIIAHMLKQGMSKTAIAKEIDCSVSTVSREIKRNSTAKGYDAKEAQKRTSLKHMIKPKHTRFDWHQKLYIRSMLLTDRYSPELISVTGRAVFGSFVSHETIYKWIWRSKHQYREDKHLYTYLRHGRRKRKRGNTRRARGITIKERTTIDQRCPIANQRGREGDLEVDFMMGKHQKNPILVVTDRTTLFTRLVKLDSKNAVTVRDTLNEVIKSMPCKVFTLTFDNDMSFALHYELRKTCKVKTYFTNPYSAQEKGTVENRIGLIRRFLPKKTDFRLLTYENVQNIESLINNRPVRKFNYLSPYQITHQPFFCTY
jgi:IS30 family transposase